MGDTLNILGLELLHRIAAIHEQLARASAELEVVIKSLAPADTDVKRRLSADLSQSMEEIQQALDQLEMAQRAPDRMGDSGET